MSDNSKIFFSYSSEEGSKFSFNTSQHAKAWITKELEGWEWIPASKGYGLLRSRAQHVIEALNQARIELESEATTALGELIGKWYKDATPPRWIEADSSDGEIIRTMAKVDQEAAMTAMAYLTNTFKSEDMPLPTVLMRGVVRFEVMRHEHTDTEPFARRLNEMIEECERTLHAYRSHGERASRAIEEAREANENFVREREIQIGELANTLESSWKRASDTVTGELDALKQTVTQKLQLHSAVKFWEERERNMHTRSIGSMLAGLFVAVAGAYGFSRLLISLNPDGIQPPTYIIVRNVLASSTYLAVWFWWLRIIARMYLSHTHLGTDASERVVVVKTYLALSESGDIRADDAKSKELLLQQLFRHAATGVVKDDSAPMPQPIEVLNFLPKK